MPGEYIRWNIIEITVQATLNISSQKRLVHMDVTIRKTYLLTSNQKILYQLFRTTKIFYLKNIETKFYIYSYHMNRAKMIGVRINSLLCYEL